MNSVKTVDKNYVKKHKLINIFGVILWIVLFALFVPIKLIKKIPYLLLSLVYVIVILLANTSLIGNHINNHEIEFSYDNINQLNGRSYQIASVTFALALASSSLFSNKQYKDILKFMVLTLVFGPCLILPIYFMSNRKNNDEIEKINILITRIRNVFLSYSVGFLMISCSIILFEITQ